MNILYIIGNGFDLNLNLKTGYQHFYDHYLSIKTESPVLSALKNHLGEKRYTKWADLEKGLGEYTENLLSIDELEEIEHDLTATLKEYLLKEQSKLVVTSDMSTSFMKHLRHPESFLAPGVARVIEQFENKDTRHFFNFMSFNYTDSLEKLIAPSADRMPYTLDSHTHLQTIRHIHLTLSDDEFIMGVNDDSQILNKSLICEQCRDLLVKPHMNHQLHNLIDEDCKAMIRSAHLFCLFGVSIGETDNMWWEEIGNRLIDSGTRLILFAYENKKALHINEKIEQSRKYANLLVKRCGLEGRADIESIRSRIYVGINTQAFKLI